MYVLHIYTIHAIMITLTDIWMQGDYDNADPLQEWRYILYHATIKQHVYLYTSLLHSKASIIIRIDIQIQLACITILKLLMRVKDNQHNLSKDYKASWIIALLFDNTIVHMILYIYINECDIIYRLVSHWMMLFVRMSLHLLSLMFLWSLNILQ